MKLTKKEITEISRLYNLGRVVSVKTISGGSMNFNFDFKTDKGDFIVRVIGKKLNAKKKRQLQLEFRALDFLDKKKFLYETPLPIKNNKNNYLSKIKNKNIWVYKKIKGRIVKNINSSQLKEMIRSLAFYHKSINKFPIKSKKEKDEMIGIKKELLNMKKVKPKKKTDILMLKNIDMIINMFERIKNKRFEQNILLVHMDLHKKNILYKGDKVVGILDFENIKIAPRIRDIAYLIKTTIDYGEKRFMKRVNIIIKEYDKVNPLTKTEKKDILLILARDSCEAFYYFYKYNSIKASDGDYLDGDYLCLNWTINTAKQIVRELNWSLK